VGDHVVQFAGEPSALLLIPAFVGVKNLMRERSPRWADLAGGAVLLALLVAIGDSATDLMYWQMGAPGANLDQMNALSDRYHNVAGSSLVYAISGIMVLLGAIAFGIGLWRSRTVPVWAALTIPAAMITNVFGYATGNQAVLVASAVVLLAGFTRIAAIVFAQPALAPTRTPAKLEAAAMA
jgi:membrane protein YdbS with pleckstrin-like domain